MPQLPRITTELVELVWQVGGHLGWLCWLASRVVPPVLEPRAYGMVPTGGAHLGIGGAAHLSVLTEWTMHTCWHERPRRSDIQFCEKFKERTSEVLSPGLYVIGAIRGRIWITFDRNVLFTHSNGQLIQTIQYSRIQLVSCFQLLIKKLTSGKSGPFSFFIRVLSATEWACRTEGARFPSR